MAEETQAAVTDSREPQGSLTIRIPETFGVYRLLPVVKRFQSHFPKVRLSFMTCAHDELAKDLRKGITDLAFLLTESIQSTDLEVESLGFETVVIVASPEHPLSTKPVVRTQDLAGETILWSKVDCSYRKSALPLTSLKGSWRLSPGRSRNWRSPL